MVRLLEFLLVFLSTDGPIRVGLAFTWAFVLLSNGFDDVRGQWDWQGSHIIRTQDLYFVSLMTILVVLPWLFTRKVKVDVEIPSAKVAVLRFERGMQQGLLGRISRTSVLEYHAFGIISEGKDAKYHYMVCGVQGDFTRGLVENPPTHIWTRELKVRSQTILGRQIINELLHSSPESRTHLRFTSEAFG